MAEVSKNIKYVKLDDGVSFSLVRTNPKLTTNTKLMYNGKKMYMESYASSELMNRTTYKNVSVKQKSTYNKDIASFLMGSGSQAYNVYKNFSDIAISDNYDNQFETFYWCGAEYIDSSFYDEEIGFIAPLYLREKLPNYFLIFKLDTPSNYNLNEYIDEDGNIKTLDSTFDFKTDILDKAVLIKTFDLREGSVLGNYIRNYVEQEMFEFDKSIHVNFSNCEVTYYGINRVSGILEKKVENFENELLKNDNPILKNDKWFTEGFERNGLIFPYIMNIEYLFDDDTLKHDNRETYDFARYIGLYCNNIEFGEFDNFDELNTTNDNSIYYFEDKKNVLHRYVKKSNENNEIIIDGKNGDSFDEKLISGFEKERISGYAEPLDLDEGYINRAQYGFEILKPFEPGDWVGIEYDGHVDYYFADDKNVVDDYDGKKHEDMTIGEYSDFRFSVNKNSNVNDIADALVKSVNRNKKGKFEAKCLNNVVVFYAKRNGNEYNGSESGGAKILIESSLIYNKKVDLSTLNNIKYSNENSIFGNYYIDYFCGSCNEDIDQNTYTYKNIFKIYIEESVLFSVNRYLKTNNGNGRRISANLLYINAEGNLDPEYKVIIVDDVPNAPKINAYNVSVSSTYQVEILDKFKPNHGVLSFFPVKDFDFDINQSSYGQYGAFVDECNKLSKKIKYESGHHINDTYADSDYRTTQEDTVSGVKELAKSPFFDNYGESLETEYDYYLEQFHPDLCLMSKSVPYISKWGYFDEQKDSCENPYRLNVSKVFGVSNLSANTYLNNCDEKEYTHSMPYYMTFDNVDYYKNYQYIKSDEKYINDNTVLFDENGKLIDFYDCVNYWVNKFKSTDEDMFSYFFTGKKYGKRFDRKYSRLMNGDKFHNPYTLFRGVKFEAIRQFNGVEKRSSEYNGYKFSFIYIPVMVYNMTFDSTVHFVKNDTFKFIVGIVFVNTMLGIGQNSIFDGNIDYFNKGFIYSACKDIIKAENKNIKNTFDFDLKYSDGGIKNIDTFSFKSVYCDLFDKNYDWDVKLNTFYMWREVENDKTIVFITNTTDIKNKDNIICWLDESKIDINSGFNNSECIRDLNELDFELIGVEKNKDDDFKILWKRNYDEFGVTTYGYKTIKQCGYIECKINSPFIIFENIAISDIFDIEDNSKLEISKLHVKQGSLRNMLINIGTGSIREVKFNDVKNNRYIKFIDVNYSNEIFNVIQCKNIKFDIESGDIIFEYNESGNIQSISDIENYSMDITIQDEFDTNHESLGYKNYFSVFEQISMYNIAEHINNDYSVKYYSTVEDNKYKIRVIEPDNIVIEDKYEAFPEIISQNNKSIVGSVSIKEKSDVDKIGKMIINRYSGFYNPIFNDILYYGDYAYDKYELPYSNTNIDYNYNDGYGEFGVIKNLYYHKTNIHRSDKILTCGNPIYPAINEYALSYKDYNIFSSSWDYGYFISQDDLDTYSVCDGIGSMKDSLCMFGSKYLNLPDYIFIDTFENGEMWDGRMVMDIRDNTDTEIMYREVNNRFVRYYLFIEKRLKRYLKENLIDVFSKHINKKYSFGNRGTIEDDVDEYVEKNLLKLYKVDKVYMYIKSDGDVKNNRFIENEYLKYVDISNELKMENGFPVVNVVDGEYVLKDSRFSMNNINEFDRHIIYNLKTGYKESFGFGVSIKRK